MKRLTLPKDYKSPISQRDTQRAIKLIKDTFQVKLALALNLDRVTAPLIVTKASGINDDLNGVERKVNFTLKEQEDTEVEIVQSLAKWKRAALAKYGYNPGEGIYTDMNAIRRDDDVDNLHSVFVDQWDWEAVITQNDRNLEFLKSVVCKIANAIYETKQILNDSYPQLGGMVEKEVFFITTQELEDMYPDKTAKERENAITNLHKTVFIMQIGGALRSGNRHDGRAPDYDDWTLNGDLFIWDDTLDCAVELSSMGIRVDDKALVRQLKISKQESRMIYPYHKAVARGEYPLTIGGGIGQSRLCLVLLGKAHIGEVQVSVWPEDMVEACRDNNIILL